jgi:hypothetical protein
MFEEMIFVGQETEPPPEVVAEAIAVTRGGLGKAELEFITSLTTPIFWVLRNSCTGKEMVKNGSLFFLRTGENTFGVTAAHVVVECFNDSKSPMFVQCMIGRDGKTAFPIHLGDRLIDAHPDIDIATLRFSAEEVDLIGRTVLTGAQRIWPPRLIEVDSGVTYCGFPGHGRRWLAPRELSFGSVPMAGIVTNANETCISIQIERERLFRVLGDEDMPEDFNFGGVVALSWLLSRQKLFARGNQQA